MILLHPGTADGASDKRLHLVQIEAHGEFLLEAPVEHYFLEPSQIAC